MSSKSHTKKMADIPISYRTKDFQNNIFKICLPLAKFITIIYFRNPLILCSVIIGNVGFVNRKLLFHGRTFRK